MQGISLDGARQIWTKSKVENIDDFKGIALRVPDVPIYVNSFESLGFITTIVPWGDCYTAVQTGVVEGLEMDYNSINDSGLDKLLPYCLLTNHSVATNSFVIPDSTLSKLTEEQKNILLECIDDASDYINNLYFEKLDTTIKAIEANGVTFSQVLPDQATAMSEAVKPIIEDYLAKNCQFTAAEMDAYFTAVNK